MQLIDNYSIFCDSLIIGQANFQKQFNFQSNKFHKSSNQNNGIIYLISMLCKFQDKDLVFKITSPYNNMLLFQIQLVKFHFIKCKTLHQRILVCKYFLKFNQRNTIFHYRLSPKSGQLNFTITLHIFKKLTNLALQDILFYILDIYQIIKQQFSELLQILDIEQLNLETRHFEQKKSIFIKNFKTYVVSSPFYAWHILEKKTKDKTEFNQNYQQKKKEFRNLRHTLPKHMIQKSLANVYLLEKKSQFPFNILNISEDENLRQKYLQNLKMFKKQSKLLNEITLINQNVNVKHEKQDIKINTMQYGKIKIYCQYNKNTQALEYQKNLLIQLPKLQFIGLPKYYFFQNLQISNYTFTNLYESVNYNQFLSSNSQTISFLTKLNLLLQVARSIKYLKDNFMLYHNLTPKTIVIKKGMIIKLKDFSSSYHLNYSQNSSYLPFVNKFPFVSNKLIGKQKSVEDQKSDSYSLGALAYYTFFGNNFIEIKGSTVKSLDQLSIFKKLSENHLNVIENCSRINKKQFKILLKFLLDATSHQKQRKMYNEQNNNQVTLNIGNRPYLDWLPIILDSYYQFNLNLLI